MIPVTKPFIKGTEAAEVGMVKEVVPHTNLMTRAQVITVPYFVSNVRRPSNKYGTPVKQSFIRSTTRCQCLPFVVC